MNATIYVRLLSVVGLAVLGIGVGWAGSSLGVDGPIADAEPSAEFMIAGNDVTLSDGDDDVTVVDNVTEVESLTIAEDDGDFAIETDESEPLPADDRELAAEIALNNESVRECLEAVDEYELVVEPIVKMDAGSVETVTVSGNASEREDQNATDSGEFSFTAERTAVEKTGDTVTVSREPSHVEDEAIVRITHPENEDVNCSVLVDLDEEAVRRVTA